MNFLWVFVSFSADNIVFQDLENRNNLGWPEKKMSLNQELQQIGSCYWIASEEAG